jgi:hypothetical protein
MAHGKNKSKRATTQCQGAAAAKLRSLGQIATGAQHTATLTLIHTWDDLNTYA